MHSKGNPVRAIEDLESYDTLLVRADLNSPVENGVVQDNQRFKQHATTLQTLANQGHVVVCLTHQGRPDNSTCVSLEQHAAILSQYIDTEVQYVNSVTNDEALNAIEEASAGDILLLENLRMHTDELPERPAEEHADSSLVRRLSSHADGYVNDAFSVAHRSHASVVGFPLRLPSAAGPVMQQEYTAASSLRERSFDGDIVFLSGGVKAEDVFHVMQNVDSVVDTFLVAGVLGELFLRVDGYPVGTSVNGDAPYDELWNEHHVELGQFLERRRGDIVLPTDLARRVDAGRAVDQVASLNGKNHPYFDIASKTVEEFSDIIQDAGAVFMKGAPGVFEEDIFSIGTVRILRALANSNAYTVVGGGDTARALQLHGFDEDSFSHVSTAGGAYIRALTGETLPAVEALKMSDG